jgi:hypothetical protein
MNLNASIGPRMPTFQPTAWLRGRRAQGLRCFAAAAVTLALAACANAPLQGPSRVAQRHDDCGDGIDRAPVKTSLAAAVKKPAEAAKTPALTPAVAPAPAVKPALVPAPVLASASASAFASASAPSPALAAVTPPAPAPRLADAAKPAPPPQRAAGSGAGTVLWVVRFANEVNPNFQPTNLAVVVEDATHRQGGQFVFKPFQAVPGQFAEFLVRLDLPAGDYRISRLFGVAGQGQTAPQFDFPAEQRFPVDAAQTHYLGRIEVTNRSRRSEGDTPTGPSFGGALIEKAGFSAGSPRVTAHDQSDEDLVSFRTRFNDLRERRIETRLPESFAVPAPRGSNSPGVQARFPQAGVLSGEFVAAQELGASAGDALPLPMRSAFASFASSKLPRAFAYDPAGAAFGAVSGGQAVIARALQQCEERRGPAGAAGRAPCVLYAVDDTMVVDKPRAAAEALSMR